MGALATWGSAVSLAAACAAGLLGRARPAMALQRAGAALAAVAVALLAGALVGGDYTLAYVAEHTDRASTWPFRLAALWGAMAGSLLLWAALVAAWGARRRAEPVERAVTAGLASALLLVVAVLASPWPRLRAPVIDGLGLTPILEHPAMLYHPPILYLGLTGLAAPFATAVAGAPGWEGRARRQLLWCVAALTLGMTAGAHWAYAELGWGGYWAWDPVENTALLPWLAALAALHLLRRRALVPAAGATAGALVLALVGTTITRSGAASSVHAFAEDAAVGWALLGVTAAVALAAVLALARRARRLPPPPGPGGGGARPAGVRGAGIRGAGGRRRIGLRAQPWLALLALLVVLLGTLRPLVGGEGDAVDGSFFARFTAPLAVAAVVAMAAAGALRPSRRRPGHLAHLGFVVLLAGVAGTVLGDSASATLEPGASLEVGGRTIRNDGVQVVEIRDHAAVEATLALDGGAVLRPARVAYPERGLELAETAVRSTPLGDVQAVLHSADDAGRALVEVHVRPLLQLVWWGGLLLAASAAWAATATATVDDASTVTAAGDRRAARAIPGGDGPTAPLRSGAGGPPA